MRNRFIYIKFSKCPSFEAMQHFIRQVMFFIVDNKRFFDMEDNELLIRTFNSSKEFGLSGEYISDFGTCALTVPPSIYII